MNLSCCKVFGFSFKFDCVRIIISVILCKVVDYFLLIWCVILIFGILCKMNLIISIFSSEGMVFLEIFLVIKLFKVVSIIMLKILKMLFFGRSLVLRMDYKIV